MKVGGIFSALHSTLAGLSTQMKRMSVISENLANVEKSPDAKGNVYQRKVLIESGKGRSSPNRFMDQLRLSMRKSHPKHIMSSLPTDSPLSSVRTAGPTLEIVEVKGEKLVFNPTHPHADENGYVKMPNVNTIEEMVAMISASRAFEANISVMDAAKKMAKKALEI